MSLTLFLVMSLAAYRLYRIVAKDSWPPAQWFRRGLGELIVEYATLNQEARAQRLATVEEMLLCSWCLGAWLSFATVSVATLFTSVPLPVFQGLGVACVVGFLGGLDD